MVALVFHTVQADPSVPPIDISQIGGWISGHKWVPLIAFVVGFMVRLLKSDTKLPTELPSWARPYLGILFAIVLTACASLVNMVAWKDVLNQALQAILLAILAHETIVEGYRKGEEIHVPGLTKRPDQMIPGAAKVPSDVVPIDVAPIDVNLTHEPKTTEPPEPPKNAA